jgi:NAD-dependent SIR2 family protein deacetylase
MTRCVACDKNLNDYETTRKDLHGNYLDMCNRCYNEIKENVLSVEREDLSPTEELESEIDFSEWSED